ncbi:hypothetical protein A2634_03160 [Candidatus Amesbacteria bacterium RIFCSPHIGHO2_01_FULL_48_32]|uniref:GNAT family N-acetyltransferase n=1 Tax=Candidatus Amesbacteria bacterium RIFCSPLOWO2_01_FULL_48_25 TaxID=1797259 RepID=A0A1F4ZBF6_9BACT|nr:MAG: hypothetical protein A2634_03160 [Candidatus Amesbacteria bacterium RIFCSPHIGHO2_01_FULL_48_32]OGD03592.1 MAG: hypothetical protein A2989_02830 [Candidatus Amesbacteria bacterium RIFCSPLOWO2_01_FULL_48_25]HJZ04693.1 GNAT family N-acetyltransferase [Patescibacteria group bacterium]
MLTLVPRDFKVPERLDCPRFVIRKLCASDVYLDYMAVMSSVDIIKRTRGGKWPTPALTFEDDLIDLAWHQREFEFKSSFAYTVVNKEGTECLGCLYFFKPGTRKNPPENADVDVSFWVTQKGYEVGLYPELYQVIKDWLNEWPFKKPYWSNSELP